MPDEKMPPPDSEEDRIPTDDPSDASTLSLPSKTSPPSRIGPYKILEKLGVGGMGVVYLAEQERPVRRRVALKLIKLGMDTKQVLARFESERQALAMMNHANIAKEPTPSPAPASLELFRFLCVGRVDAQDRRQRAVVGVGVRLAEDLERGDDALAVVQSFHDRNGGLVEFGIPIFILDAVFFQK